MIFRFIAFLLVSLLSFSFDADAQLNDKEKLEEAFYLIDDRQFLDAQKLLEEAYEKDKENANINYNLGLVYLKSFHEKDKEKALPFLELATKNVSPNYTPYSPREKKAPVDAWFYYGLAQHNDYQFLEAIESYNKFRTYVNDKHPLYNKIDQHIRMSNYAPIAIQNPVSIKTTNLGDQLNGFFPDFSPVVRIDESAIYFTSRRIREDSSNMDIFDPIDGMLYEDIYVSFNDDGKWGEPYPLNINTEGHEATVNLSVDGRTLYIYKDIRGNGELYKSELEDDSAGFETWSTPEKLGSNINTKAYETHVAVTPDQSLLYFISDRDGGFGGKDIYYCRKLPTGNWALAQNAGPILNSEFDEDGVFIHPDGETMFYSSNGLKSMGGYDIVRATKTDSGWTSPENLGYPINSVDDDVFFVTTPDGKRAYFSSFKEEGYGEKDVYMLELVDAEEASLVLYRGEFTFVDRMTPPSGAYVTITDNETGQLVGEYAPRQRDGQFSAILEPNKSYHFEYVADAYESYEEDIYVPSSGSYSEIYKDIKLRPVRVGRGMETITPAPIAMADIKGGLIKIGKPLKGMEIQLLTEDERLIQKTTSDSIGDFQFSQLDPSNTYLIRVISEDGNPLQNYEVAVTNDLGEVLVFEELDDTTYIFVPSLSPYEFYGISAKQIAGTIKKAGVPIAGLKVKLEDEEKTMIQQEETDQYGEFNFQKLSLDETYRIVFEGDFPDDPEILITNELGQQLAFRQVDEGIYEYVPVGQAKGSQIVGVARKSGVPIAGLNVRLEDKNQTMLQKESTDQVGEFNFQKLDLDQPYRIVFEGDFPDDGEIVLTNEFGQELTFIGVGDGVYEYVPKGKPMPKAKLSDIAGAVTSNRLPIKNLNVLLFNKNMTLLNSAKTDSVGKFNFMQLDLAQPYTIKFEGNFPDDISLIVANEDYDLLLFRKIDEGVYKYDPVLVRLETSSENVLKKEITDNVSEFNFSKLRLDQEYKIVYEGDFPDGELIEITNRNGEKMVFLKKAEGVYVYTPKPIAQRNVKSYTIGVEDSLDFSETYPRPQELRDVVAYYQKYFIYNAKDVSNGQAEFRQFIADIADLVSIRGDVQLIITSSASKVPTKTWKTNSILTRKRAFDTKALLEKIFKERGIKPEQYNFVDINTLITGPEYKGDYITNKSTYEKYQYVRIFVK